MTTLISDAVAEAVGVNVHMSFPGPYKNFDTLVRPMLQQLGVRYIRDWAIPNTPQNAYYYAQLRTLLGDGIYSSLILFDQNTPGVNVEPSALDGIVDAAGGSIRFIEGTNEPDYKPNYQAITRPRQIGLYNTVKGSPGLPCVTVLGPGLASLKGPSLLLGDLGPYVDAGNWHTYPGGDSAPEINGIVSMYLQEANTSTYIGKPLIVTEDGYNYALASGKTPCPITLIARWLPRMVLYNLLKGIPKTFLYELISLHNNGIADPQSCYGMVPYVAQGDATPGQPLPQFFAIQNLISLFADPGPLFVPLPLAYSVTKQGTSPSPANVLTLATQKRDGAYLLAIWIGQGALPFNHWKVTNQGDINIVPPQSVNVNLPATVSSVTVYRFADDGTVGSSLASVTNGVLPFTATDSLAVLKFTV